MNQIIFNYLLLYFPIDNIYCLSLANRELRLKLQKYWSKVKILKFRQLLNSLLDRKKYMNSMVEAKNDREVFDIVSLEIRYQKHIFGLMNYYSYNHSKFLLLYFWFCKFQRTKLIKYILQLGDYPTTIHFIIYSYFYIGNLKMGQLLYEKFLGEKILDHYTFVPGNIECFHYFEKQDIKISIDIYTVIFEEGNLDYYKSLENLPISINLPELILFDFIPHAIKHNRFQFLDYILTKHYSTLSVFKKKTRDFTLLCIENESIDCFEIFMTHFFSKGFPWPNELIETVY